MYQVINNCAGLNPIIVMTGNLENCEKYLIQIGEDLVLNDCYEIKKI